jgi:hypothetical protein
VALTIQTFPIATRLPQVTVVATLAVPASTRVPVTVTLAPTATRQPSVTPLPIPPTPPGLESPTPPAVLPPVEALPTEPILVAPGIAAHDAYLIDPDTFQVRRPAGLSASILYTDVNPAGQVAAIEQVDAAYPGFGYGLVVNGLALNGSPLPSASIRFTRVRWSPDGQSVAFIAETPGSRGENSAPIGASPSDGLWVWTLTSEDANQHTQNVLLNHYAYQYGRDEARMVNDFAWSPDSQVLVVELDREDPYPGRIALLTRDGNAGVEPLILPYENASWARDGRRILVSGMMTDHGPILGWLDRETQAFSLLVDGRALATPLWMQDAVELVDRRIAFLGAAGNPGDPGAGRYSTEVGLYVYNGINAEPVRLALLGGGPVLDAE